MPKAKLRAATIGGTADSRAAGTNTAEGPLFGSGITEGDVVEVGALPLTSGSKRHFTLNAIPRQEPEQRLPQD